MLTLRFFIFKFFLSENFLTISINKKAKKKFQSLLSHINEVQLELKKFISIKHIFLININFCS
jgi:hypothetical protein